MWFYELKYRIFKIGCGAFQPSFFILVYDNINFKLEPISKTI